jgi:2-dehydropantoate 2-reductase
MRILMLGAGGIGGYFGARIHCSGGDVTFLVRPARANYLLENGLHVFSPLGDMHITPKFITSAQDSATGKFDAAVLSCKAYDLHTAIDSVVPALAPQGIVIPLLNGFAHLALLDAKFGRERVLGGLAHLGVTLTPEGEIQHLNELHGLVIGGRSEPASPLVDALAKVLARSGIDFSLSDNIESEMWDKFVFLATLAGATCTLRASVGEILQTHSGEEFILGLLDECSAIAKKHGHIPSQERLSLYRTQLTMQGSTSTASMLRDIERKGPTEADHILGDMIRRAHTQDVDVPLLKIACSILQAYEIRSNRERSND